MTNADKIRSMTVEELAKFVLCQTPQDIDECTARNCNDCVLKWLKEEAEQTMPETKKQKTMLEDFFEKYPNAKKNLLSTPAFCPSLLYDCGHYDKCSEANCIGCWSRPVPPRRECYKNVTVIVEYDENGEPDISWVRQEDTERISEDEAIDGVKIKVKENE